MLGPTRSSNGSRAELNTTVGNTVTLAVRALRQDRIGEDLRAAVRDGEAEWLDANLG